MKLKKCCDCGKLFAPFNRTNKWGGWLASRHCKACLVRLSKYKKYKIKVSRPIPVNKKMLPNVREELR